MPYKSSIALLAELKIGVQSCLDDAEKVFDMIDSQDWCDVDEGELTKYWFKIVNSLDNIKEKIEEFQR